MIGPDLDAAARSLLARPRVLVALDFDGVLAPIVEHRDQARPVAGGLDAVRRLAGLPEVEVALVSGRALDSLRAVSGLRDDDQVTMVGSHGAESRLRPSLGQRAAGPGPTAAMTAAEVDLLARVVADLRTIVADAGPDSGLDVELKPTGAVLHVRRASAPIARRAEAAAWAGPAARPGVHATRGKAVVELAVTETSKGVALQRLRALLQVDGVLYAGDDATDETAFAVLEPGDVGVKVGPGDTAAAYRVDGPDEVRALLQLLVAERSQR